MYNAFTSKLSSGLSLLLLKHSCLQVRKLYEPELFSRPSTPSSTAPLSNTHTLERHFDRLFGNATERRMDEIWCATQ